MTGSQITQQPPREIQLSTLFWVGAVAAGGVESILGAADAIRTDSVPGLAVAAMVAVRMIVYTVVLAVASQLWLGRNWARWTLAIGLGIVGMATLLVGPIGWLGGDHALTVDAQFVSFASVRSLHVVAVVAAVVLMFRPRSNRYFRAGQQSRRPAGVVPA